MASAIHKQESATGVYMPPPTPPHLPPPLMPLDCLRKLALGSYIKLPLVIHFTCGNVYVSVLLKSSQIIPFFFPHCAPKSVLYISISFAALQVGASLLFF